MKCMSCGKEYRLALCPECVRASQESISIKRKAMGTKNKGRRKGRNKGAGNGNGNGNAAGQ